MTPDTSLTTPGRARLRGQLAWALVEFARNPYVSLIFMFVFAPYFAATVVGDPLRGQQLWSLSFTIAGLCIGVIGPILGAIVDRLGRRKPWIIGSVFIMAPACWALWYAMPAGHGGLPILAICSLVILLMVCFEGAAVAHNAMLPSLTSGPGIGRLSAYGVLSGAAGSFLPLVIVLFGIVLPATHEVNWSFLPEQPLFGLTPQLFEHARIVGPIAGIWMLLFLIPFALWTPDLPSTGVSMKRAVRDSIRQLRTTIRQARKLSNISLFLLARMLFYDGIIAIQAYCGIYAAGVFGWNVATIMLFAIILVAFCVLGGFLGAWLDPRLGSRRAILISLSATILATFVAVSVTPDRILFIPYDAVAAGPVWSFPYFRTLPEIIYVAMYIVLAMTITAIIASSRALMAQIAPTSMMNQFFGLYALSGTATAFVGHGMVALFTRLFHSQRVGFASLLILLFGGFLLVRKVQEERAPDLRQT